MNLLFLPDLVGMLLLMGVLAWVRRRHRDASVDLWMLGLGFIFLEAVSYALYRGSSVFHAGLHTLALDSYIFAAVSFGWAARRDLFPGTQSTPLLLLTAMPLLVQSTAYGLGVETSAFYLVVSSVTLLGGAPFLAFFVQGSRTYRAVLACIHTAMWAPALVLASFGATRGLIYWGLGCLYLLVALSFRGRVRRDSIGGIVTVVGFCIWAAVFFLHPLTRGVVFYDELLQQVWNMQKFLVIIGMLLTLLESETTRRLAEAMHDPLTGLPNRRLFDDRLALSLERARRSGAGTALFCVDLNDFKSINDTCGHPVGDVVLQRVAASLRGKVRSSDTLARCGGDEFTVIVNDLNRREDCETIAEALRSAVASVALPITCQRTLSASVGYALFPHDALDATPLCQFADARMYEDKRTGPRLLARA